MRQHNVRAIAFYEKDVLPVLQAAVHDGHREVRWSAGFSLFQLGHGQDPGLFDCREGGDGWCELIDGERR